MGFSYRLNVALSGVTKRVPIVLFLRDLFVTSVFSTLLCGICASANLVHLRPRVAIPVHLDAAESEAPY
jgi:hypothetical protein